MAHKKFVLLKDFNSQKKGSGVIISENQVEYFFEKGLIEVKGKKTKTKKKIEVQDLAEIKENK
tara:strand:+ start:250 stop:438 length:189 start_codon:yes stop_codon:yes gene_type:complete